MSIIHQLNPLVISNMFYINSTNGFLMVNNYFGYIVYLMHIGTYP